MNPIVFPTIPEPFSVFKQSLMLQNKTITRKIRIELLKDYVFKQYFENSSEFSKKPVYLHLEDFIDLSCKSIYFKIIIFGTKHFSDKLYEKLECYIAKKICKKMKKHMKKILKAESTWYTGNFFISSIVPPECSGFILLEVLDSTDFELKLDIDPVMCFFIDYKEFR